MQVIPDGTAMSERLAKAVTFPRLLPCDLSDPGDINADGSIADLKDGIAKTGEYIELICDERNPGMKCI